MSTAPAAIRVEGLDKLRRAMQTLGPEAKTELRLALRGVAVEVAQSAQGSVPVVTGAARSSIRAGTAGAAAVVRAGGPSAPYFGWLDFGGTLRPVGRRYNTIKRARIRGGRYLYPEVRRRHDHIVQAAQDAIRIAVTKVGLD